MEKMNKIICKLLLVVMIFGTITVFTACESRAKAPESEKKAELQR